jgi:hypothetical protein
MPETTLPNPTDSLTIGHAHQEPQSMHDEFAVARQSAQLAAKEQAHRQQVSAEVAANREKRNRLYVEQPPQQVAEMVLYAQEHPESAHTMNVDSRSLAARSMAESIQLLASRDQVIRADSGGYVNEERLANLFFNRLIADIQSTGMIYQLDGKLFNVPYPLTMADAQQAYQHLTDTYFGQHVHDADMPLLGDRSTLLVIVREMVHQAVDQLKATVASPADQQQVLMSIADQVVQLPLVMKKELYLYLCEMKLDEQQKPYKNMPLKSWQNTKSRFN